MCTRLARGLRAWAGPGRLEIIPLDAPGALDLHRDLSFARALKAVQLLRANGYLCQGAEAGANALGLRPGFGWLPFVYYLPLLRQLCDLVYFLVSRGRRRCASCH